MTDTMMISMDFSGEKFAKPLRLSQSEALGRLVRRWWPEKTREHVRFEFDLSEYDARSVVEGRASRHLLDRIIHNDRDGILIGLLILEEIASARLGAFVASEKLRSRHAAHLREERSVVAMARRLLAVLDLAPGHDPPDVRRRHRDDLHPHRQLGG